MATLALDRIEELLRPYLGENAVPGDLPARLSSYLDLLLRWNARTNLTAIREPEAIVRRHFGESLFLGCHLPGDVETLLDYGSGAGFPGVPIQLLLPGLRVTLAEVQTKKASFLREAVRVLELPTEVWADRVSAMPTARRFDAVAMRAVDRMEQAAVEARGRVRSGGWLAVYGTELPDGVAIPGSERSMMRIRQVG